MEKHSVSIIDLKSRSEFPAEILADESEASEKIILSVIINGQTISGSDDGYFPAYQKLRDSLLSLGYGVKCSGSRINAVQSAMMSLGSSIYLVEPGRQALKKDIVSLYSYAEITEFPDTQRQNEFFDKWCDSLK